MDEETNTGITIINKQDLIKINTINVEDIISSTRNGNIQNIIRFFYSQYTNPNPTELRKFIENKSIAGNGKYDASYDKESFYNSLQQYNDNKLSLCGSSVDHNIFLILPSVTSLQILDVSWCRSMFLDSYGSISYLTLLTALNISRIKTMSNFVAMHLSKLTNLIYLDISCNSSSYFGGWGKEKSFSLGLVIPYLTSLTNLQVLNISFNYPVNTLIFPGEEDKYFASGEEIESLGKLTNFTMLDISYNDDYFNTESIRNLILSRLSYLNIKCSNINLEYLPELTSLIYLNISHHYMGNDRLDGSLMSLLLAVPNLEVLDFSYNDPYAASSNIASLEDYLSQTVSLKKLIITSAGEMRKVNYRHGKKVLKEEEGLVTEEKLEELKNRCNITIYIADYNGERRELQ